MAVPVKITVKESDGTLVSDILVQVYDLSGVFVTEANTDVFGEADFLLTGSISGIEYFVYLSKEGWSFPQNNRKSIVVMDPPVGNEFEFVGVQGTELLPVSFRIVTEGFVPTALDGVSISVYDENDDFVTQVTTIGGLAGMILPGDADPGRLYFVRLWKTGVIFENPVQRLFVITDEANNFDFVGRVRNLPDAVNVNMCRVSGTLRDASLHPIKNASIEFFLISYFPKYSIGGLHFINMPAVVDGHIIAKPVKVVSDKNGYVEIDLIRGAVYDTFIHGWQHPDGVAEPIQIPTSASAKLEDVLFPYAVSVDFDQTTVNLAIGDTADLQAELTVSNGRVITQYCFLVPFIKALSSDENVARLNAGTVEAFVLEGIAPGTATLLVQRELNTSAPRRPQVPDLVVTPVTITVT